MAGVRIPLAPQDFAPVRGLKRVSWDRGLHPKIAQESRTKSSPGLKQPTKPTVSTLSSNFSDRGIQLDRHRVKVGVEQVRIHVKGHRRLGVSEHPLDRFHVGPGADR